MKNAFTNLVSLATSLALPLLLAAPAGCSAADAADADAVHSEDHLDQSSADIATITVALGEPIGGQGGAPLSAHDCTPGKRAGDPMDCTDALAARFGAPALHDVLVPAHGEFFCYAMRVQTVIREAALATAEGIGFYSPDGGRFVAKADLVEARRVTLKDGSPGVVHDFVGLAGCWRGDATASASATYALKAYAQFEAGGSTYKNWELGDDHVFHGTSVRLNRASELLR